MRFYFFEVLSYRLSFYFEVARFLFKVVIQDLTECVVCLHYFLEVECASGQWDGVAAAQAEQCLANEFDGRSGEKP